MIKNGKRRSLLASPFFLNKVLVAVVVIGIAKRGKMEEFVNEMRRFQFQLTNSYWNDLELNKCWSVGMITDLISRRSFRSKEEWVSFYYESGNERLGELSRLSIDEQYVAKYRIKPNGVAGKLSRLNSRYGRTREALDFKGSVMYEIMKQDGHDITLEECQYAVRYRVLGETWNGLILREKNTANSIQNLFNTLGYGNLSVVKASPEIDSAYEVDFEVYNYDKLLFGVQVKPKTYLKDTPYLRDIKVVNEEKNRMYFEHFGSFVFYIYSETNGKILNQVEFVEYLTHLRV